MLLPKATLIYLDQAGFHPFHPSQRSPAEGGRLQSGSIFPDLQSSLATEGASEANLGH